MGGGLNRGKHLPENLDRGLNYERTLILYLTPNKKYARFGPGYMT